MVIMYRCGTIVAFSLSHLVSTEFWKAVSRRREPDVQ